MMAETAAQPDVYSFKDLDDRVKDRLRQPHRELDYDWYEPVYEDAKEVAKCLGVTFDPRLDSDKPCIYFSGFASQGDGASFAGVYTYRPDAMPAILGYAPNDADLHLIAKKLTVLGISYRLVHSGDLTVHISVGSGSYCHSDMMRAFVPQHDDDFIDAAPYADRVLEAMRLFADWIYKQLESAYDYCTSDECIDQYFVGQKFDRDGNVL